MAEKVLLVNPNQMKPAVAPIAIDYLASALAEQHFQADVLDLCFSSDWAEDINHYFRDNSAIAVGISLRNTDDTSLGSQEFFIPGFKEIVDYIRKRTSAPLIIGGAGFSIMPEAILDYFRLDLGITGDGEKSLPLLVEKLASNQDYSSVPGLVYRTGMGFHRNPPAYIDMSNFPPPGRESIDNRRYFTEGGMGNIETKRGCNKGCIYCADPLIKGKTLRFRSPKSVADEIESLLSKGIDYFHFCDSEFNLPPSHAEEICLEITRRGLGNKIRWFTYASPAPFTEEMAVLFQRAGCQGINFGVDSGNDQILRGLGRDFNVENLSNTAGICHRQGLVFMYDLLLGCPGETKETLQQTIEFMKELSPSRVGAALGVRVFQGTELARMIREPGPLHQNPGLLGNVSDNEHFFAPIFYLSPALEENAPQYLADLIADDERFFFMSPLEGKGIDYNYNQNDILQEAIHTGYRGAFWDILRRLQEKKTIKTA